MVPGIDVSHLQGVVDWPGVRAAGAGFAFIKASQGEHFADPMFHSNWLRAKAAGLVVGAYHYFEPTRDAAAQAKHFLEVWPKDEPSLPPALDVEVAGDMDQASYSRSVQAWLDVIEAETGRKAIIYTYPWFGEAMLEPRFGAYPLWIAAYRPQPVVLPGWNDWTFWQSSGAGRYAGISGLVDLDQFNRDAAALAALR